MATSSGTLGREFTNTQRFLDKAARLEEEKKARAAQLTKNVDAIPKDVKYPYVFKFSESIDPRLLKYRDLFETLYHRIMAFHKIDKSIPPYSYIIRGIQNTRYSQFKAILYRINPKFNNDNEIINLYALFMKLYDYIPLDIPLNERSWPPIQYPDVPVSEEESAALPPLYSIRGYTVESRIYSAVRIIRNICDSTANPDIINKPIQEVYNYCSVVNNLLQSNPDIEVRLDKREEARIDREEANSDPNRNRLIPKAEAAIANMRSKLSNPVIDRPKLWFKIVMGNKDSDIEATFREWFSVNKLIGTTFLHDAESHPDRYTGIVKSSWINFISYLSKGSFFTEDAGSPFIGSTMIDNYRLLKNRNQQVFFALTSAPQPIAITPSTNLLTDTAWIQFNNQNGIITPPNYNDYNNQNFTKFQGYRLYDLPPPSILKAFAHGVPVAMSDHVRELYPEWTRPDTLAIWLDGVMAKWRADISNMAQRLKGTLCVGGAPNDNKWHLRDVPTIQLDLYNDVLAYIAEQRGVPVETLRSQYETKATLAVSKQSGGSRRHRKTHAKSKGMRKHRSTRKQQRGGATSMPLAYYQDGAQMRGTYAEQTGVGLGASTNTMARSAIQQTGGFAPSIMGPMVQNGMMLMPVASYMGYKMLKGSRSARRSTRRSAGRTSRAHHKGSRYAHRGPRSTHKKRRVSRKH